MTTRTAASYIGALVSLGLYGGLEAEALEGLRSVQAHLQRQGWRSLKRKQTRIEALYDDEGYARSCGFWLAGSLGPALACRPLADDLETALKPISP
ncbi:hypothetical protein [Marinovum sp.]|uniref:hypothetical protein n=1 Tax=Marinovum sp. TaxID=2024839 RepID=UPI003A8FFFAC